MAARHGKPLQADTIVTAAITVADRDGMAATSMRRIAAELGVEAMSLYHHFRNRDALLDAMVDRVFAGITVAETPNDWQASLRDAATAKRAALHRHPWALPLLESRRNPGPATLAHHDGMIGILRRAGFTLPRIASAYALIDAYVYGFVVQEQTLPLDDDTSAGDLAAAILSPEVARQLPNLAYFAREHVLADPDYRFADEFDVGLSLILAALSDSGAS